MSFSVFTLGSSFFNEQQGLKLLLIAAQNAQAEAAKVTVHVLVVSVFVAIVS